MNKIKHMQDVVIKKLKLIIRKDGKVGKIRFMVKNQEFEQISFSPKKKTYEVSSVLSIETEKPKDDYFTIEELFKEFPMIEELANKIKESGNNLNVKMTYSIFEKNSDSFPYLEYWQFVNIDNEEKLNEFFKLKQNNNNEMDLTIKEE